LASTSSPWSSNSSSPGPSAAGDGGVDLGDEGGLVLDELRAAAIPVQAEAAPAATVGHERAAQLVADPTRPQQLA
jgi:hypothetical protein